MVDIIKEYRKRHPWCEVATCTHQSAHIHHIRTRGAGGKDWPENLMALCAEHHGEAHAMGVHSFAGKYKHLAKKIKAALGASRV